MINLHKQLNELRGRLDSNSSPEDVKFVEDLEEIVETLEAVHKSIALVAEKVNDQVKNLRLVKELKPNVLNRKTGVIHEIGDLIVLDDGYYFSPTCRRITPLHQLDFLKYQDTDEPVTCKNCLKVLESEELN